MKHEIASEIVETRTRKFRVTVGISLWGSDELVWDAFAEHDLHPGFQGSPIRPIEKIPKVVCKHGNDMIRRVKDGSLLRQN